MAAVSRFYLVIAENAVGAMQENGATFWENMDVNDPDSLSLRFNSAWWASK